MREFQNATVRLKMVSERNVSLKSGFRTRRFAEKWFSSPRSTPRCSRLDPGSGFRIPVSGFRVPGWGVRVLGLGVWGSWFRVKGLGCRVWGVGFRVQGAWFSV